MWPQEDIPAQYIEDITCLSKLLWLEVNFLVEPFPQCTRYMYILIYIKGSKNMSLAIHWFGLYLFTEVEVNNCEYPW